MPRDTVAAFFLFGLLLGPCLAIFRSLLRPNFSLSQALMLTLAELLTRLLWRAGRAPSPPIRGGGAIIVCNHRSSVDPFFVQVCCDRPIRWLVAKEYCEHPAFGWFLRICNVIPVNRGGIDTAATKAAIRCVSSGGLVGMFPEGRINMTEEFMLPVRPGAMLVALKAGVPLIPCHILGSPYDQTPWSPFLRAARVRVRFGTPIDPGTVSDDSEHARLRELMLATVSKIAELAEQTGFQPVLAGRRWKPE